MLFFRNKGLIPLEAVTIMGVNVKENPNAIGHFGTGLKITIAGIMRLGGKLDLWRGEDRYQFSTQTKEIRGKDFEIIYMNGRELPFTTELGKNWEPWMFYRELESNCRDELGDSGIIIKGSTETAPAPLPNQTLIYVECDELDVAFYDRDKYFITTKPVYSISGMLELHAGEGNQTYYRGIAVGELDNFPYKLNILKDHTRHLTEDRTLAIAHARQMLRICIPTITDKEVLRTIFPSDASSESNRTLAMEFDFDMLYVEPSEEFFERLLYLYNNHPMAITLDLIHYLVKHGRLDRHDTRKLLEMTPQEKANIERAFVYLEGLGYENVREYEVHKTELGPNYFALADRITNKIYVTPRVLDMGVKQICSMMHEEFLHLRKGLTDCSRDLQSYLFDKIATMYENKTGRNL